MVKYVDQAIADVEMCIKLDPAYSNCYRHLARIYFLNGEEEKGLETFLHSLRFGLTTNDFWIVAYFVKHEMHHAAALLMKTDSRNDATYPYRELRSAIENPEADHAEGIRKLLEWSERTDLDTKFLWAHWVALGEFDRVMFAIDANAFWLESHKAFRTSDRFRQLLIENRVLTYWQERGFPNGCQPVGDEDFVCD